MPGSLDAVGCVDARGTSTGLGDLAETKAMKTVFGPHARKLMVSSTKSELGHLLGASGGVELVISALAIDRGVLPPSTSAIRTRGATSTTSRTPHARPASITSCRIASASAVTTRACSSAATRVDPGTATRRPRHRLDHA
ncbi:MAG: hypothetical protein U0794_02610 [Isosphaeraceae bacterium]